MIFYAPQFALPLMDGGMRSVGFRTITYQTVAMFIISTIYILFPLRNMSIPIAALCPLAIPWTTSGPWIISPPTNSQSILDWKSLFTIILPRRTCLFLNLVGVSTIRKQPSSLYRYPEYAQLTTCLKNSSSRIEPQLIHFHVSL